ncbi:hypothetical protein [Aurantiacibacter aquimixticola]|uniref:Uncharacterized protein n=1 Tax=Aurantiacibacter aquimixticola TaxID=1958945 RepID=A0A419RTY8_9SPHN|nr:hypothetical protein [Aurantiacibacter aquimixticola]RJY09251.1 hypothetical protein D6201_07670 [Aurantiacibacter aquimixticola]
MGQTGGAPRPDESDGDDQRPYRYANSRPIKVFALAWVAALGALGAVWVAQTSLEQAAQAGTIAQPPNVKDMVERLEHGAEARARDIADAARGVPDSDEQALEAEDGDGALGRENGGGE